MNDTNLCNNVGLLIGTIFFAIPFGLILYTGLYLLIKEASQK